MRFALIIVLLFGPAKTQDDARRNAVEQMRHIATAMKSCPEEVESQIEIATIYFGPPTNLEWDVADGKTARAPFQGVAKFGMPERFEETEKSKNSKKLHQRYVMLLSANESYGHDYYYKYESDLGNGAPELIKMLFVNSKTNETKPLSGKIAENTCLSKATRMSTSEK